ncbi:amino acid ABC transporter ATP-binding protein [Geodermatophilus nigrescens]|uniref:ABC-type polar-amino-acid transporter n=1 Tax=Geodermatophilus nigrescens TaxID=1070870 RepID=A0A1M5D0M0_9ACTN|nr:amino acid ABC transporter ATP-binding protein, PAAT family [Geodermatophilus nigrescens]
MSAVAQEPAVVLDRIHKQFGDLVVVRDVSLTVARGEVVAIIGPSGSGKSTLLRCINLLERADSGRVEVVGRAVEPGAGVAGRDLAALRRSVGMVFQSFNLFPHMTVLRNVSLPQERVLGRSRAEADARSRQLLERVGLAAKADTYPSRCSGGQQQRVAIARALALDPEVMLFDEPTSALDPELGLEVLAVMRELAADGMTMVVVTHEIHFAADVADRVVVMADGAVLEEGTPEQVLRSPSTERARRFLSAVVDR